MKNQTNLPTHTSTNTANVYTPLYLARLGVMNKFVRERVAEGYQIISAQLLPNQIKGKVVLNKNFIGECPEFLEIKQAV